MSTSEGAVHADFDGLAEIWDNMKVVRDRLQDYQSIMLEKPKPGEAPMAIKGAIAKHHPNLRYNSEILTPLMVKMKDHRDKFPDVNALTEQVKKCFEMSRLNPSSTLKPLSRTISVVKPELVGEVSAAKSHQLAFSWWETYHRQIIPEFMLTFGLTPLSFTCRI